MRLYKKLPCKMCFGLKLYCKRTRLSPAHCLEVLASSGSYRTSVNVCCKLMASENQKRPRSMGPEKVNRGYQFPKRTPFWILMPGIGLVVPKRHLSSPSGVSKLRTFAPEWA